MPDLYFRANGKLLLSGEYFVLDGAKSLALATQLGQSLNITFTNSGKLEWMAFDQDRKIWGEANFLLSGFSAPSIASTPENFSNRLQSILAQAKKQNPNFLTNQNGYRVETRLEFPRQWGLGSSSTLLSCLAQWADINVYTLLENTMGGSGYDLACAENNQPLVYWREEGQPIVALSNFNPPFSKQLYFVYLGKKQNSREGIKRYRKKATMLNQELETISQLSLNMEQCESLTIFEELLIEHEILVAQFLDLPRAQDIYFTNYWGVVKSLGAWGGDFVLATSRRSYDETKRYFNELGFSVVLKYDELILFNT